jgi:hypothetical protein
MFRGDAAIFSRIIRRIDGSHYRLILKLGKEMQ